MSGILKQPGSIKQQAFSMALLLTIVFALSCYKIFDDEWKTLKPCPGLASFEYEGRVYKTVQIGDQCWMAENLDVGGQINSSQEMSNNGLIEKYCYNNDPENCIKYGGLYTWEEAVRYDANMLSQTICPPGWYLPTQMDWLNLMETDYEVYANGEWGGYQTYEKNTNSSGFSAYPAGAWLKDGSFDGLGTSAMFISQEKENSYFTLQSGIYNGQAGSIRCIKRNNPPRIISHLNSFTDNDNKPTDFTFSWTGYDSDNDDLYYDLHFGQVNSDEIMNIVLLNTTDTSYTAKNLATGTIYQFQIMVTDKKDTTWSDINYFRTVSLSCEEYPVVEWMGQTYNTVKVGNQCWFRENLNAGEMIHSSLYSSNNGIIEKYCYDNNPANCTRYGGLYLWSEAMNYDTDQTGICPPGWRIPRQNDFTDLFTMLGKQAGGKMKEIGFYNWSNPNTSASNSSGLTILATGYITPTGNSIDIGKVSMYMHSTTPGDKRQWFELAFDSDQVLFYSFNTWGDYGGSKRSLRCIKY